MTDSAAKNEHPAPQRPAGRHCEREGAGRHSDRRWWGLVVLLALVVAAPLLGMVAYSRVLHQSSLQAAIDGYVAHYTQLIADGLRDPIWNLIPESGQPIVSAALEDERVLAVRVESFAQGPFLSAGNLPQEPERALTLVRPVLRDGQPIGQVRVTFDRARIGEHLFAQHRRFLVFGVVQVAVSLLVVAALAFLLLRVREGNRMRAFNVQLGREVDERRGAEERLRAGRDELRLIADNLPALITLVDGDGRYRFVNQVAADWYGSTCEDLLAERVGERFAPEERAKVQGCIDAALGGQRVTFNEALTFPDGVTRNVEGAFVPDRGPEGECRGFIALVLDVSEAHAVQRERDQSRRLLETVLNAVPIEIFVKGRDGRYLLSNEAFQRNTQKPGSVVVGSTVDEVALAQGAALQKFKEMDQAVLDGAALVEEPAMAVVRSDGSERVMRFAKLPLREEDGTVAGVVGIGEDITERMEIEEQLRQAQKMESIGQLAGGVAHDFNNLLQVILGYTNLALDAKGLPGDVRQYLEPINNAAKNAAGLTAKLLAFSRKQALRKEAVDLAQLLREQSELMRRFIGETIRVETQLPPTPLWVPGDKAALEQVLLNLCINARDAMADGAGTLSLAVAETQWPGGSMGHAGEWLPAGAYAVLTVRDSGAGMGPEVRSRAFEPFFTTKEVGQGSGLGLPMVYGIVRQHEGMIDVHSEPGQGAEFTVYLPRRAAPQAAAAPERAVRQSAGDNERILIVEDEAEVLQLLEDVLTGSGYQVLTAMDGVAALDLLQREAQAVDLAIVDAVMPRMAGRELYQQLQADYPGLPVIFSTGYSAAQLDAEFMAVENVTVVHKPYEPHRILRAVRAQLDAR